MGNSILLNGVGVFISSAREFLGVEGGHQPDQLTEVVGAAGRRQRPHVEQSKVLGDLMDSPRSR